MLPTTSGEKGITTTVLCASNATGHFVPPMMIFKRKNKKASLTDQAPPGTIQGCSENGWVNTELFIEYTKHFVKHVKCSLSNPVLMIFDGHKSHTKSLELIDYARENGLYLLSLPPHTTHKLQPLDRAVFKPLKAFFNNACQKWMRNHPGRKIQTENLGELFNEAYIKSATLENAVSSFRTSGIVPYNPDIVPEHEYIEDPRPLDDTTDTSTCNLSNFINANNPLETQSTHPLESNNEIINNDPSDNILNQNSSNNSSLVEVASNATVTDPNQISFDINMAILSEEANISLEKNNISFEEILQVPKLTNLANRRGEKSEIITGSPYKRKLQEEQEQGKKKKPTKKTKTKETKLKGKKNVQSKPKPKLKKQKKTLSKKVSNIDKQEWICPVCKGTWKETQTDWIICSTCTVQVHDDCTGNDVCFLCG